MLILARSIWRMESGQTDCITPVASQITDNEKKQSYQKQKSNCE